MPERWFVSPVVTDADGNRLPLASTINDPGKDCIPGTDPDDPPLICPKYGMRSCVINGVGGKDWALCLVKGDDLSAAIGTGQLDDIFEQDYLGDATLDTTLRDMGMTQGALNRSKNKLSIKSGVRNLDAISLDSTQREYLLEIGRSIQADWQLPT